MFDIFVGVTDWECTDPGYTDPPEDEDQKESEE